MFGSPDRTTQFSAHTALPFDSVKPVLQQARMVRQSPNIAPKLIEVIVFGWNADAVCGFA